MPPISADTPAIPRTADPVYKSLIWRRNFFGALAAVFLFLSAVTAVLDFTTTVRVNRTFAVGPSPHLIVRYGVGGRLRGGITVHAGDDAHLHVEGKVHGTWRVRYVLEQRGDDVVIEAQPRPFLGWLSVLGPARFAITAPAQTRLDIDSSSAPIEVERIAGGGALRATNGTIRLQNLPLGSGDQRRNQCSRLRRQHDPANDQWNDRGS